MKKRWPTSRPMTNGWRKTPRPSSDWARSARQRSRLKGSDIGIFGPVVDPVPSGAEALALWDSVYVALHAPYLYEIKRNRPRRSNGAVRRLNRRPA